MNGLFNYVWSLGGTGGNNVFVPFIMLFFYIGLPIIILFSAIGLVWAIVSYIFKQRKNTDGEE